MAALGISGCGGGNSTGGTNPPPAQNPIPTITGISPATIAAGSGDTQITIAGSGFTSTTEITASGKSVSISSQTSTQLVAIIPSADLTIANSLTVSASNPSPGGGTASAKITVQAAIVSAQPSPVVASATLNVSILGADTTNLANNIITFTQTGRSFTSQPTSFTTQGTTSVLAVPLPSGMSPASATASIGIPTLVSAKVNNIDCTNPSTVIVGPPPHAIGVSPDSAAQGTSFSATFIGDFTSFSSASIISSDDPGLTISSTSYISATLMTGRITVGPNVVVGSHVLSITTSGTAVAFPFQVLLNPSGRPTITAVSHTQIAPGAPLSISGSGFLPAGGSSNVVVRYSYSNIVGELTTTAVSDGSVESYIPLLTDPTTGAFVSGSVQLQVVSEGVPSNSVALTILPLPPNTGVIGSTTQTYINNLLQQLNGMPSQLAPVLLADDNTAFNRFLSAATAQLQQLQTQIATAAGGGTFTAPDGSTIDQSTIDIVDRILQTSGIQIQVQSSSHSTLDRTGCLPAVSRPRVDSQEVTLTEAAIVPADKVCKAVDTGGDISDQLTNATIATCAISLLGVTAPVAGPVCGILRSLTPLQSALDVATEICAVAPINMSSLAPNPLSPKTTVNGAAITESPTAIFSSTGSAVGQVAESTTDLFLTALRLDKGIFRYIFGNKIVASAINDLFQEVFDKLLQGVIDTSIPHVYYYVSNPVALTQVSLQPDPNGFFTFSSLTMTPLSNAGTSKMYFGVDAFRALDSSGEVANSSLSVPGNQMEAVIQSIVTVTPPAVTVAPGGQQRFTASVQGVGAPFQGVTWAVDSIMGGNSSVGVISTSGLYTAPQGSGTHTITATSQFDGSTGAATATLSGTVSSISISPTSAVVPEGSVQTFAAIVQGGGTPIWTITEGSAGGTINGGVYTAPSVSGTYHVVATNSAVPSEIATATVIVNPGPSFAVIHSFDAATEGAIPWGALIWGIDGDMYGTTITGGSSICGYVSSWQGCGTVYRMDTQGNVQVLKSFTGKDGAYPSSALAQASDGTLYGTTGYGGTDTAGCDAGTTPAGCGTIFSLTPPQGFNSIYSFGPYFSTLGISPEVPLTRASDGNWYGENIVGGATNCGATLGTVSQPGCGTIFRFNGSTPPSLLHAFAVTDGAYPSGGLIQDTSGDLFGVTQGGGASNCSSYAKPGCGTIFKVNSAGSFQTIHRFTQQDGAAPAVRLILGQDGYMYGTTLFGGSSVCSGGAQWQGCGTVFKIDSSGSFVLLHSFTGADGAYPDRLYQAADGFFYGAAQGGGDPNCRGRYGPGCGVVFRMDAAGNVTVLHSFTGQSDGSWPESALIQGADGTLYGTAAYGGANDDGVAFKISNLNSLQPNAAISQPTKSSTADLTPILTRRPHLGLPIPTTTRQ